MEGGESDMIPRILGKKRGGGGVVLEILLGDIDREKGGDDMLLSVLGN